MPASAEGDQGSDGAVARAHPGLPILAIAGAFLALLALWRWSAVRILLDDAFISYRYAANWVAGKGLVYTEGVQVEGYTNLLWTLMAGAAIAVGADPAVVTRAIGVACYVGLVVAVAVVAARRVQRPELGALLVIAMAGGALVRPGLAAMAGSGLETLFFGVLLASAGVWVRRGQLWPSALLASLAYLTRPEGALALLVIPLLMGLREARAAGPRQGLALAARWTLLPAVVVAAHLLFRLLYYGALLPNTYYAKAADVARWAAGFSYLGIFVSAVPESVVLVVLALLGAIAGASSSQRWFARYCLCVFALYCVHVAKAGGDFMEYRFMWSVYPLLLLPAAAFVGDLSNTRPKRAMAAAAVLLVASSLGWQRQDRWIVQPLEHMGGLIQDGTEIGRTLGRVLPEDTVISTTLAGTIAYYSGLPVVDEWGLSEPYVREMPAPQFAIRGHVKRAPKEYLRERGVALRFEHPVVRPCDEPHILVKPVVFVRLENNRCVRAWYFSQTPELTKHLCSHPEDFVLSQVACAPAAVRGARSKRR